MEEGDNFWNAQLRLSTGYDLFAIYHDKVIDWLVKNITSRRHQYQSHAHTVHITKWLTSYYALPPMGISVGQTDNYYLRIFSALLL